MAKGHQTTKKLFDTAGHFVSVEHISPYLVAGSDLTVPSRTTSLSNLPDGYLGCLSLDKGNFIFSEEQYDEVTAQYPELTEIFKKYGGSSELIHNKFRRTLWMNEESYKKFSLNPVVAKRVEAVYQYRISGGVSARGAANTPFEFFTHKVRDEKIINHHNNNGTEMLSILVPRVSSQNRLYVPMGIVGEDTVISDSATAIYDAPMWLFGLLESRMHMTWLRAVGGKLETRYRYSTSLVYNTFPVPELSTRRKNEIEDLVWKILDIRDEEGGTLAELYGSPLADKNPKPMNPRLKVAHEELDRVVDRAYRDRPFKDDNERLALLLDMYRKKVNEEK